VELFAGEAAGDVNEAALRRIQIREAIKAHFDKEQALFQQGIKVLDLVLHRQVASTATTRRRRERRLRADL
jgi:type III restriction enzyme